LSTVKKEAAIPTKTRASSFKPWLWCLLQLHDDILVAKMRPGQCIDLEAHCVKGIGAEHAKWSPVATAWYRLHPEVVLTKKVKGKDARLLAELCPGLFNLTKVRGSDTHCSILPLRMTTLAIDFT
jgi:DNA-directed RNA polymerase alpha subunit